MRIIKLIYLNAANHKIRIERDEKITMLKTPEGVSVFTKGSRFSILYPWHRILEVTCEEVQR